MEISNENDFWGGRSCHLQPSDTQVQLWARIHPKVASVAIVDIHTLILTPIDTAYHWCWYWHTRHQGYFLQVLTILAQPDNVVNHDLISKIICDIPLIFVHP